MADAELEERLRDAETRARDAEAMMIQVHATTIGLFNVTL